ncbi:ankyrin repeat domain-containing protein [Wolbachia pipientis]|uniref:ankyrin repeat domain-containing protein n=1 Tax=Wolbachia pipientis TaxID=955 RepID=UPI00034CAC88|nr:ankyrin repeat domain-containing protein [Wolbachia pipientis]
MKFKTNSEYDKSQTLIKKLFPNKESIVINDQLTIEVKYGGLASYTPEYIKQTVKDAYGAWSDNFYSQKSVHSGPVKLQLYVLKNYDDYKAHIKELSGGKDHRELWGGGTVRAHEADGTIAKTFIVGDVNGLLCAKSKILMEKMSDAFLEYSTGNMDTVPEVLRTGMKLFMWSYDAAKKESTRDMHYTKEAYNKMHESGHDTPYKIASMSNDYRISDCLVTFLQEKHPQFIKQLLTEMSFDRVQAISKFKHLLNNSEVEKEFKQWMDVKSGDKIVADLVPDSEVMTFGEHKLQINIKYDDEELTQSKLSSVKNAIESTIKDFDSAFGINNSQPWHNIPNKVNVFVFNTKSDYENYLKELNVNYKGASGLTVQGRGSEVHVYFYLQDQFDDSCKTLKHELGHALTIINSYYGTGDVLSKAMHEGVANYMASLEDGRHVNDHGDKEALIAIRNKDLKPDEILRNNIWSNKGEHYHSDAEQVIKFLEDKHPDMIDNLLKSLSKSGANRSQGNKLFEDFLAELKGYDQEFKQWVKAELSGEQHMEYNVVESNSVESSTSQQSTGKGLYGYSPVHNVSGDKTKIESVSREDSMQPAKKVSEDEQGKAVTTKVMKYNKQPFLKVNIDDNNVENTIGKVNEINKVTGATSLHFAASLGDLSKVAMLLKHNSYTDTRDHNGQTPLHYAIQSGNTEVAKYLIDHGANLNVHDNYYQKTNTKYVYYKTPLHYAIESGNIEIAKYLIDRGANPNIQDAYSKTPLYSAIYSGNTEIVKYLLDHNADPNSKSYYTFPLLAAIKLGNAEIVKSLIEHGADLGIKNTSAQTLLHYAIELKHTEIAKYLIDRGIDVDTRDISSGKSPLHFAMYMKNMEVVKYLIEHNADIDIQDSYGLTPLHLAVDLGNKKMIEQLVEKGANINAQDNDGWTPLVHAVRHGKLDTIEYLIKNKADVDVVGKDGRTLVEHAELWAEEKGLARDVIDSKGGNDSYYRELSKEAATWEKAGKDMLSYLKKITMQEEESNDIDQMPADQPASEERSKRSIRGDEEKQEETIVIDNVKQHPLKIKVGEAVEIGKYKVELQVTYDDVRNFYDTIRGKYHDGSGYNYEQVMVLYNEIVRPASQHHDEPFTLAESYIADGHLFIKNQDFGILKCFNEMFYKSDEFM